VVAIWRLADNVNTERIVRLSLEPAPTGLLTETTGLDGAYLLQPSSGNFGAIQALAQNIFREPEAALEPARVEVQNGTTVPGLAASAAQALAELGFTVVAVRNAEEQTATETVVYDLTNGAKPSSLATVRVLLEAKVVAGVPAWLAPSAAAIDPSVTTLPPAPTAAANADFIVVIGTDHAPLTTSPGST
jgi:hypothetical protein